MSAFEVARDFAAHGYKVFPVHSVSDDGAGCSCGRDCGSTAKHPRTRNGLKDATTDERTLLQWDERWPDANWAVACGDRFSVVDIDPRHGGDPREVIAAHELAGPTVWTGEALDGPLAGERGVHVYRLNGVPTGPTALAGVEIRSEGAYVLLAGSRHASGVSYQWSDDARPWTSPLVAVPEALRPRRAGNGAAPPVGEVVPTGQRNNVLTSAAGTMRRRGMSKTVIAAALLVMNREQCQPPLPECEVRGIAASVGRYPPTPRATTFDRAGEVAPGPNAPGPDDETANGLGGIPEYPLDALPEQARALVAHAAAQGIPAALTGGGALAALAAALGGCARLSVTPSWRERAILWVPLLAPRGAGKSPAQGIALDPLRQYDAEVEGGDESPRLSDQTLEALARELKAREGSAFLDLDELSVLLRGLGEYKGAGSGDQGRFLSLWSGAPWKFTRVAGGAATNKLRLHIPEPTLVVCGGLQPALHKLLGGDADGLGPRWLPHLAGMPQNIGALDATDQPSGWNDLLRDLLGHRREPRSWSFTQSGRAAFTHYRTTWKRQARGIVPAGVEAALDKADTHLARVALVLAEAEHPGAPWFGAGAEVVERAASIIEFTLGCWRALPEQDNMILSRRDQVLDTGVEALRSWLESRGGKASRRDIQQARVAGARRADQLGALLGRYEATFPGTVTEASQEGGGLPTVVVRAPTRGGPITVSTVGNTVISGSPRNTETPVPTGFPPTKPVVGTVSPPDCQHRLSTPSAAENHPCDPDIGRAERLAADYEADPGERAVGSTPVELCPGGEDGCPEGGRAGRAGSGDARGDGPGVAASGFCAECASLLVAMPGGPVCFGCINPLVAS